MLSNHPIPDDAVVVTGLGLVSPLGLSVEESWTAAVNGRSGIAPITAFDAAGLPTRIAGEVKGFRPEDWMDAREARRTDRFVHFALAAAEMAVRDAGLEVARVDGDRVGVVVGSGMGGLSALEDAHSTLLSRGPRRISPFFVPAIISNLAPGQISLRYGFRGPNFAPVAACATSNYALGEAFLMLERDMADVIIAGGTEATLTPLAIAGFSAARAMSQNNDQPEKACRPFDRDRDGFVAAEGAGLLVLERMEHARKRGARIYARLSGYGVSADAHHVTLPAPQGEGAQRSMRMALRMAKKAPEEIGHLNAHATSTPAGDVAEAEAIAAVFGAHTPNVPVTATKSMTGHMLGAAGAAEAIFSVLSLHKGILLPTINLDAQDSQVPLDIVANVARERRVSSVMSNGFGFGGTNATVLFEAV